MNNKLIQSVKDRNMVSFVKEVNTIISEKILGALVNKKVEIANTLGINESLEQLRKE